MSYILGGNLVEFFFFGGGGGGGWGGTAQSKYLDVSWTPTGADIFQ